MSSEIIHPCKVGNCNKVYYSKTSIRKHLLDHLKILILNYLYENPYRTDIIKLLKIEQVQFSTKYKCKFKGCSSVFTNYNNYKEHLLSHSHTFKYCCYFPQCFEKFEKVNNLKEHLIYKHEVNSNKYLCYYCDLDYTNYTKLLFHIKDSHKVDLMVNNTKINRNIERLLIQFFIDYLSFSRSLTSKSILRLYNNLKKLSFNQYIEYFSLLKDNNVLESIEKEIK